MKRIHRVIMQVLMIFLFSNGPVGIAQVNGVSPLTIYPTMSNGNIFIEEAGVSRNHIQVDFLPFDKTVHM